MNHVSATFKSSHGVELLYNYWESGHGLYARIAFVFHNPFIQIEKDGRFIQFLLANKFKVVAVDLSSCMDKKNTYEKVMSALAEFFIFTEKQEKRPCALFAESVWSLPLLVQQKKYPFAFKCSVFLSPIFDWTTSKFSGCLFFKTGLKFHVTIDQLSGSQEELSGMENIVKKDVFINKNWIVEMRKATSDFSELENVFLSRIPTSVYCGDDDSFFSKEKSFGPDAEFHSYPRIKHLLVYDKYWKHLFTDLERWFSACF